MPTTSEYSLERLLILDADGTTVDAFAAIAETFSQHGMQLGDLAKFQKRRHIFKYLGGVKELPNNLSKQLGKRKRKALIETLTQVYREEARLFPGIPELVQTLIAAPRVKVGLVTRNITHEPAETMRCLFKRHGIDTDEMDFVIHVPLRREKTEHFRATREHFQISPAWSYVCGDERKDFHAAIGAGMHPFMVSYGFEDHRHLTEKAGVPEELISGTPAELAARVRHALDISP
ncbi:HAD family hydrolase [Thiorhodococcus mannitoliphagus]|uniref:phosphoglycolate phosphatase n=1 Tax=Thiorhodococcus mannitoliphagus TaxID=329406 RepID=A0A6P1DY67_9GAMM|nr:HAD hydrolase-like protein [Thiorhodococcus mannitoliphagus]NEX22639.1 HAD family hydrolase [Thiorhodococcus mannitoliphagus]